LGQSHFRDFSEGIDKLIGCTGQLGLEEGKPEYTGFLG